MAFLMTSLFLPESYLPILLDWKAKHLRCVPGSQEFVSNHAKSISLKRLQTPLPMPITFFRTKPVIAMLGGYMVPLYVLFSFLSVLDYIFKQRYTLSDGLAGSYLASIACWLKGLYTLCPGLLRPDTKGDRSRFRSCSQARIETVARNCDGASATCFLLWQGWTNYPGISPLSGLAACFAFDVATTAIYVSSYEYIIDSYVEHGAMALASITMVRYLIAGAMVMAARPMYEGIGVHWTTQSWAASEQC
ncbi:uncharacterized protein A1O9_10513 [Exophiala aquamarina CBS 119918]|uniref:Uncharacterized protein n=1 Tax=Exophiala aquamarina CBS 119918 TaxID=1182545 RepID=A0A072P2N9_9EURO|nr:uncharacterized protein A1O9_10513 [Exophiala aquamarina CBS 119918]KEF53538.1 hypothetical protein A1O9_10513 [Exophiala aquamarina CBS 119918]